MKLKYLKNIILDNLSNLTKPNSYNHQTSFDLMYDAQNTPFKLLIWRINNGLIKIISFIATRIILIIEKYFSKKIDNSSIFILSKKKTERAFILANGPSLENFDISDLKNDDTVFACNSFYLTNLSDKINVDFYSIINTNWLHAIKDFPEKYNTNISEVINNLNIKFSKSKFFFIKDYISDFDDEIKNGLNNYSYLNFSQLSILNYFPKSLSKKQNFPHAVDVSHFNLLMAYYMGIKEIIFVGLEHPMNINSLYGHKRANDVNKRPENEAFRGDIKLLKNSRPLKLGMSVKDIEDEKTNLNNYWWQWYRSLNYYKTVNDLQKQNVNVFRYENVGTLDFIDIKKFR